MGQTLVIEMKLLFTKGSGPVVFIYNYSKRKTQQVPRVYGVKSVARCEALGRPAYFFGPSDNLFVTLG